MKNTLITYSLTALLVTAFEPVFQDTFDGDSLETNTGIGGGVSAIFEGAGGAWIEDGVNSENLVFTAGTSGGARATLASLNQFDVSGGFRLEVVYSVESLTVVAEAGHTTLSNRVNIGVLDEILLDGAGSVTTRDIFGNSAFEHYGLGFSLTPGPANATAPVPPVGLNFTGGDSVLTSLNEETGFTVGEHTLLLEVLPDGTWSYQIDGVESASGAFADAGVEFDLSRDYHFYAYGQNDENGLQISSVTLSTQPLELALEIDQDTVGVLDFNWTSRAGQTYTLLSTVDLEADLSTWDTVATNIEPTPPSNTFSIVTPTDPKRFYVVVESLAEAFFTEDFEDSDGGFTVTELTGDAANTIWAWGLPNSTTDPVTGDPTFGGQVTAGSDESPLNCWGTDISNPGFYTETTSTALRSPVINLTGVSAATLSFSEALDIETGDTAVVNIIDGTTDTVLAPAIYTAVDSNQSFALWAPVPPIDLPASALDRSIRVEFLFTGVAGTTNDFLGWFIDDVKIDRPEE